MGSKKKNQVLVWIDKGKYFICSLDGIVSKCVSCGKPKEYNKKTYRNMHKCTTAHENRREAASRSAYETVPTRREKPYGKRLAVGFAMLEGSTEIL